MNLGSYSPPLLLLQSYVASTSTILLYPPKHTILGNTKRNYSRVCVLSSKLCAPKGIFSLLGTLSLLCKLTHFYYIYYVSSKGQTSGTWNSYSGLKCCSSITPLLLLDRFLHFSLFCYVSRTSVVCIF